MDALDLRKAAAALLTHQARLRSHPAWSPRGPLPAVSAVLPPHWLPADTGEAYALAGRADPPGRHGRVAGRSVAPRRPSPTARQCWRGVLVDAPESLAWDIAPGTEFECEIAFTFAQGLPAREQPYTEAEVAAAIGATRPSVELLAPRFAEPATPV